MPADARVKRHEISQEYLRSVLHYDPDTGKFKWTHARHGVSVDMVVGHKCKRYGYWIIALGKKNFLAHRLAFIYMTGSCPLNIDHIDRDKLNNKWSNLREATTSNNAFNRGRAITNKSGHKNVFWSKNRFVVSIKVRGEHHYLGRYTTVEEAATVAAAARARLCGEFVRHA
jgi:hypothetical protein